MVRPLFLNRFQTRFSAQESALGSGTRSDRLGFSCVSVPPRVFVQRIDLHEDIGELSPRSAARADSQERIGHTDSLEIVVLDSCTCVRETVLRIATKIGGRTSPDHSRFSCTSIPRATKRSQCTRNRCGQALRPIPSAFSLVPRIGFGIGEETRGLATAGEEGTECSPRRPHSFS